MASVFFYFLAFTATLFGTHAGRPGQPEDRRAPSVRPPRRREQPPRRPRGLSQVQRRGGAVGPVRHQDQGLSFEVRGMTP